MNLGVNFSSWWVTFRVSRKNTPMSGLVGVENFVTKMYAALNLTYWCLLLLHREKWERSKSWSLAFFKVTCPGWMVSSELSGFFGCAFNTNTSVRDPIRTTHSSQRFPAIRFISAQFPLHDAKSRSMYCG